MKSSGVVQGLKSLASKLHPQLPLTARESNSLLKTLNTSFRKHLDDVHPTVAEEEETKSAAKGLKRDEATPRVPNRKAQSAAASTDDLLTKLLTNPLFERHGRQNVLDYATAKAELASASAQDPLELLERYQENGAASVQIAELCLNTAWTNLLELTDSEREQYIKSIEPGRRALRWLLRTKSHESEAFWKSPGTWTLESQTSRFTQRTTKFLLLEGREETTWEWLSLDLPGPEANVRRPTNEQAAVEQANQRLARYAWRGQIVEAITSHRLVADGYDVWHQMGETSPNADSINRAIDDFIRACELKLSVDVDDHLHWMPLRSTFYKLVGATRRRGSLRSDIDVAKFDRWVELLECISSPGHPVSTFWQRFLAADFQLWHPTGRRPLPIYHCLKENGFRSQLLANPGVSAMLFRTISRAIFELRRQGHADKATDLDSATRRCLPDFAEFSSDFISRRERADRKSRAQVGRHTGTKTFTFNRLENFTTGLT